MSQRRHSLIVAALALVAVAAFPTAAFAQQAAAFTNPFDAPSDISGWYWYNYPFTAWQVDSSPVGGVSGASLNFNNTSGNLDFDWAYGYGESDDIDVTGLNNPVMSFWCRADLGPTNNFYQYREIDVWDVPNYNYYYYWSMGDSGYDLNCGTDGEWHQHLLALDPGIVSAGTIHFYVYTELDPYYQAPNLDGQFIDNLQILVPDITPPDAVANLAASNATLTSIQVAWSAPFDDDVSGVTSSYDLRYSTTAITGTNFNSATPVTGEPTPDVEGTPHTLVVTGLTQNTTYYFAITTTDIAGNVSAISNVPSLKTLAPPPPPPPPVTSGGGPAEPKDPRANDILPCSAGTTAAPTGLLMLAGVIALAFAVRRR